MPNTMRYTNVIPQWEKLLAAMEEHGDQLAAGEAARRALEQALEMAREMKARQESYAAARQEATQQLAEILAWGNEMAMRVKAAARLGMGPRSERLVQFGIAPLRPHRRRAPQPREAGPAPDLPREEAVRREAEEAARVGEGSGPVEERQAGEVAGRATQPEPVRPPVAGGQSRPGGPLGNREGQPLVLPDAIPRRDEGHHRLLPYTEPCG